MLHFDDDTTKDDRDTHDNSFRCENKTTFTSDHSPRATRVFPLCTLTIRAELQRLGDRRRFLESFAGPHEPTPPVSRRDIFGARGLLPFSISGRYTDRPVI